MDNDVSMRITPRGMATTFPLGENDAQKCKPPGRLRAGYGRGRGTPSGGQPAQRTFWPVFEVLIVPACTKV